MALAVINIGSVPNDGTGDPWRTAFSKCKTNFDQVFNGPMVMGPPASSAINLTLDQSAYESDTIPGLLVKGSAGAGAFICIAANGATPLGASGTTFDLQQTSGGDGFITLRKANSSLNISTGNVLRILVGPNTTTFVAPVANATTVIINNSSTSNGALLVSSTANTRIATFNNNIGSGGYIAIERSGSDKTFWGDSGVLATGGSLDDYCLRSQAGLDFATGGATRRITISSAGNAVVRTPDSGVNFAVDQGTLQNNAVPGIQIKGNAGFGAALSITANGASPGINSFDFIQAASGDCYIVNRAATGLAVWTNNTQAFSIDSAQKVFFNAAIAVNGGTPPAQVTGWGTPTGPAVVNNFSGAAATLVNCSNAIAKIITDLKAFGLYGA